MLNLKNYCKVHLLLHINTYETTTNTLDLAIGMLQQNITL